MTVNYTTLLGLAKPVTGTEAGSWGEIVNNEITTLLEDAVAATVEVDVTAGGVTLTDIDGQQDQARCAIVKVIGTPGVARDVIAPNRSKTYVVINLSNAAVTLKASGTSGVSIPTSTRSLVVWDGTNYVLVASSTVTGGVTSVTATSPLSSSGGTTPQISLGTVGTSFGGTGLTTFATGDVLYASNSTTLARRAIGSAGDVLTVVGGVPTWQSPTGGGGGGSVSSVGFAGPNNSIFPVSGSPVTTTGTLTMGYSGTTGSILYAASTNNISNLPIGTTGQVLTVNSSGLPSWITPSSIYPPQGIPVSTGTAWTNQSLSVSGSGTTVALTNSPSFTTPSLGAATASSITVSGTFQIQKTSASNPGYTAVNDTTTGIFFPSGTSSEMAFCGAGQEVMRVINSDASRTLAIGTTRNFDPTTTDTGINFQSVGMAQISRNGNTPLIIGRQGTAGNLISFYRQGSKVGDIDVNSSGAVSYNSFAGSHWSQLQDGSKADILCGTVFESIDELCEWPDEPPNERLCKAKVSDTPGSKRVYGVFMKWDNDWTRTNDLLITAVGAYICRINGSVTVQMGDLLESNGDGTARVQADDAIRSSTIGKVTCTTKVYEYDDGSYCVPTVLYCG